MASTHLRFAAAVHRCLEVTTPDVLAENPPTARRIAQAEVIPFPVIAKTSPKGKEPAAGAWAAAWRPHCEFDCIRRLSKTFAVISDLKVEMKARQQTCLSKEDDSADVSTTAWRTAAKCGCSSLAWCLLLPHRRTLWSRLLYHNKCPPVLHAASCMLRLSLSYLA